MSEIFKDIKGFEGYYQVNQFGKIFSIRKGIYLKTQINNSGYELVHLSIKKNRRAMTVHRIVAIAFLYNPESKECVNHIDGCKTNNNISNLEWVTKSENMKDLFAKGRGEKTKVKARERMKSVGFNYGFHNSQKNLSKATPIKVLYKGRIVSFRSIRAASIFFSVNDKVLKHNSIKINGELTINIDKHIKKTA